MRVRKIPQITKRGGLAIFLKNGYPRDKSITVPCYRRLYCYTVVIEVHNVPRTDIRRRRPRLAAGDMIQRDLVSGPKIRARRGTRVTANFVGGLQLRVSGQSPEELNPRRG